MDPIFALPILFAAVAILVIKTRKTVTTDNATAARERARQRSQQKAQASNTNKVRDVWDKRLNPLLINLPEVDDRYDGRGQLTTQEKDIINVLLDGVNVTYIDDMDKAYNVFSKTNKVEYTDPWGNTVR